MIKYSRWAPPDQVDEVEAHVRAHLSSVADGADDPESRAGEVVIERKEESEPAGVLVVGTLDAEPDAAYLRDDFDPEDDVRRNPLSVPSINDEESR
ncbi:hypothetical protein [Amycolatopsis anabasis]|uniref:hypothetical protein n=1 Tax=Amycolatopsis anabasis TaxID=1840409 RepID=UPI00131B9827|nr:hypothetical protein [Amycolatopsis anabasis]